MSANMLYPMYCQMQDKAIDFYYSGALTEDMLLSIGSALRQSLIFSVSKDRKMSAFSTFVEQIQNIIRYSAERKSLEDGNPLSYGTILMGRENQDFFICCGNKINNADANSINAMLCHIKSLNRLELKSLFKTKLHEPSPENSVGAGVGLIEIALRAKKGFDFGFSTIDAEHQFFEMKVWI